MSIRLLVACTFLMVLTGGAALFAGCAEEGSRGAANTPPGTVTPSTTASSPATASAPTPTTAPSTSRYDPETAGPASRTPTPVAVLTSAQDNEGEPAADPNGHRDFRDPHALGTPPTTPQAAAPGAGAVTSPARSVSQAPPPTEAASPTATPPVGAGGSPAASRRSDAAGGSFLTSAEGDNAGSEGVASDLEPDDGPVYSWHDGDRMLTVRLQSSLIAERQAGASRVRSEVVPRADKRAGTVADPVFRSPSGAWMTLPGGSCCFWTRSGTRPGSTGSSPTTASRMGG